MAVAKHLADAAQQEFFVQLGGVGNCVLSHKNDAGRAVNALGSPRLWRIQRVDIGEEDVVTTREAAAGTEQHREPPFHVHMIDRRPVRRVACELATLPVHPDVSRRVALVTTDGREVLAWFIPRGQAADELVTWLDGRGYEL